MSARRTTWESTDGHQFHGYVRGQYPVGQEAPDNPAAMEGRTVSLRAGDNLHAPAEQGLRETGRRGMHGGYTHQYPTELPRVC